MPLDARSRAISCLSLPLLSSPGSFHSARPRIPNPVDLALVALAKVFPLDYVLLGITILYVFLASLAGFIHVGIRCLWFKLFSIKRNKTQPQVGRPERWWSDGAPQRLLKSHPRHNASRQGPKKRRFRFVIYLELTYGKFEMRGNSWRCLAFAFALAVNNTRRVGRDKQHTDADQNCPKALPPLPLRAMRHLLGMVSAFITIPFSLSSPRCCAAGASDHGGPDDVCHAVAQRGVQHARTPVHHVWLAGRPRPRLPPSLPPPPPLPLPRASLLRLDFIPRLTWCCGTWGTPYKLSPVACRLYVAVGCCGAPPPGLLQRHHDRRVVLPQRHHQHDMHHDPARSVSSLSFCPPNPLLPSTPLHPRSTPGVRAGTMQSRIGLSMPFFSTVYFFSNFVFLAAVVVGIPVALFCCKKKPKRIPEGESEEADTDETAA